MATKTLTKYGCRVELDTDEVYPDDPGQGTPAMVYYRDGSATYWCAVGEGEVDGKEFIRLPPRVLEWLESLENEIDEFLYEESDA